MRELISGGRGVGWGRAELLIGIKARLETS